MNEQNLSTEIQSINSKLDVIVSYVQSQQKRLNALEDLYSDLNLIANSAYNSLTTELDNQKINLDFEKVKILLFKLIRNLDNYAKLIEALESMQDLMKDMTYIFNSFGKNSILTLAKLEEEGKLGIVDNLENNFDKLINIMTYLTKPELIKKLENTAKVISEFEIDDKKDDKSLFKIMKEMKKPAVRKAISASLRAIEEINK